MSFARIILEFLPQLSIRSCCKKKLKLKDIPKQTPTRKPLNQEEHILEYMANYLGIPEEAVPPPLRRFVSQAGLGGYYIIAIIITIIVIIIVIIIVNRNPPCLQLWRGVRGPGVAKSASDSRKPP